MRILPKPLLHLNSWLDWNSHCSNEGFTNPLSPLNSWLDVNSTLLELEFLPIPPQVVTNEQSPLLLPLKSIVWQIDNCRIKGNCIGLSFIPHYTRWFLTINNYFIGCLKSFVCGHKITFDIFKILSDNISMIIEYEGKDNTVALYVVTKDEAFSCQSIEKGRRRSYNCGTSKGNTFVAALIKLAVLLPRDRNIRCPRALLR